MHGGRSRGERDGMARARELRKRSSSSAARGPLVSHPLRRVSVTASISSCPMAGGWKERKVLRFDESFCMGRLEAY